MKLLAFVMALLLLGCGNSTRNKAIAKKQNKAPVVLNQTQIAYNREINEDSVQLCVMIHDALLYAYKNNSKEYYRKRLHNWSVNSLDSAMLYFGHLFSNSKKHLIVRSVLAGSTVRLAVFVFANSKFQLVCH